MCFQQAPIQFGENGGHRLNENVFHQMTCSDPRVASVTWSSGQTVQQWSIVVTQVWLRKTFIIQSRPIVMWAQSQCEAGQVEHHSSFIVSRWHDAHMLKCSSALLLKCSYDLDRRSGEVHRNQRKCQKDWHHPPAWEMWQCVKGGPLSPTHWYTWHRVTQQFFDGWVKCRGEA